MNQMNQIIIEGNIVREPEIRELANGSRLAVFCMAVNRYHKKADGTFGQEVSYFDCEAWGKDADTVAKKGEKGIGCRVIGRLKQDRWKGSDGKSYSKVAIVTEHIDFLAKAERNEDESAEATAQTNQQSGEKSQTTRAVKFDKSKLFGNQNAETSAEEELPKAAGFDIF